MTDGDFAVFEHSISHRRRSWQWSVTDHLGNLVLAGREPSLAAARYAAARAIFQMLLTASYRSRLTSG
jgi:hypothetical protein